MVWGRTRGALVGVLAAAGLMLSGCAAGPGLGDAGLVIGTALPVTALDPAARAGAGGELVSQQIYPRLVTVAPGTDEIVPDIAESARFDGAGDYVVTLKAGLRFANGDALDASDVVFSLTRQRVIATPGGPSALLAGIRSITRRDDRTVVFALRTPHDQGFPAVLTSPAGAIVDAAVFPATALLGDQKIVAARPFAGPYTLQSYNPGDLLTFRADPGYDGALGAPRSPDVALKLYADARNLAADVSDGAIDLAYGGISPGEARSLRDAGARIVSRPGGTVRSLVFDLNEMPYGAASTAADPGRALAVRRAVADLVDRRALADDVFAGTATPLWGFIPSGMAGAEDILRTTTGDGAGEPDPAAAQGILDAAGVGVPVPLTIAVDPQRYGAASRAEYEELAAQLETGGMFAVKLVTVRSDDLGKRHGPMAAYSARQGGWSPRGTDPVLYRAPYLVGVDQLRSHLDPASLATLAGPAADADPAARAADLHRAQQVLAGDLTVLALLQERQLAATADGVTGVRFDGSFTLRFGSLALP